LALFIFAVGFGAFRRNGTQLWGRYQEPLFTCAAG
jgi:hypothetical protein